MARKMSSKENSKTPPEVARALEHIGLFTRVASNLGVTAAHVTRVARGVRESRRIIEAIRQEVIRIERNTGCAAAPVGVATPPLGGAR
jgi:hypothetical protein